MTHTVRSFFHQSQCNMNQTSKFTQNPLRSGDFRRVNNRGISSPGNLSGVSNPKILVDMLLIYVISIRLNPT